MVELKEEINFKEDFNALNALLKSKDKNKTLIKQKIDVLWMTLKDDFPKQIRQKKMYNYFNLLFNKGPETIKAEILEESIKNIILISTHEHSKQFIVVLANYDNKYLVKIIKCIVENIRELIRIRNGIYVVNEIYKLANRKYRKDMVNSLFTYKAIIESEAKDKNNQADRNVDDIRPLIQKIFSKRLLKYEIVHHALNLFINEKDENKAFVYDLLVRNKQLQQLTSSYKGLEAGLMLLNTENIVEMFEMMNKNIIEAVNNEYSVVFILKLLEKVSGMNDTIKDSKVTKKEYVLNKLIDSYKVEYKKMFIEEYSILPIIYYFNQEAKYYPTLFNHLREKKSVAIDKSYLLKTFTDVLSNNLKIFCTAFTYLIVYFFCKKSETIKKQVVKLFKDDAEICENEFGNRLHRKLLKYKVISE